MKDTKVVKMLIRMFVLTIGLFITSISSNAEGFGQMSQTQTSVFFDWNAREGAEEYYIGISEESVIKAKEDAKLRKIVIPASETSYTFTNLKPGTKYQIALNYKGKSTFNGNDVDETLVTYEIKTLPSKITGLKKTKWSYYFKEVYFGWDDQTAIDTYEIQFMDSKGKIIEKTEAYENKFDHSIQNNKIYKVKVRGVETINNEKIYSAWSDDQYLFAQPRIKKAYVDGNKLKISWEKINGISNYSIYLSTREKKGYKNIKTLSKSKRSYTISKFKGKKFNKNKKYYAYIVAKKKVGNKTYTSGRCYSVKIKGKSNSLKWTFSK